MGNLDGGFCQGFAAAVGSRRRPGGGVPRQDYFFTRRHRGTEGAFRIAMPLKEFFIKRSAMAENPSVPLCLCVKNQPLRKFSIRKFIKIPFSTTKTPKRTKSFLNHEPIFLLSFASFVDIIEMVPLPPAALPQSRGNVPRRRGKLPSTRGNGFRRKGNTACRCGTLRQRRAKTPFPPAAPPQSRGNLPRRRGAPARRRGKLPRRRGGVTPKSG